MSVIVGVLRHPASLAAVAVALSWWFFWGMKTNGTNSKATDQSEGHGSSEIQMEEVSPVAVEKPAVTQRRRRAKKEKKSDSGCCKTEGEDQGCCSTSTPTESSGGCCKTPPAKAAPIPTVTVNDDEFAEDQKITVKVLYGTQTRTSRTLSYRLKELVEAAIPLVKEVQVINIADYENEDLMTETCPVVFFLSTYSEGTPTEDAQWFSTWLEDSRFDHRVDRQCMRNLRFAVFGLGDSVYGEHYCTVSKRVDKYLGELGGRRMCPLAFGDKSDDTEHQFVSWTKLYLSRLLGVANHLSVARDMNFDETEEAEGYESPEQEEEEDAGAESGGEGLVDLEDMGAMAAKIKTAKAAKADQESSYMLEKAGPKTSVGEGMRPKRVTKEMVTPMLRKSLEKQGYKIVGTHSGVKICRWTKAMLRGRGGCYKHTFYGIESHRCMGKQSLLNITLIVHSQ
ncbi:hypothetical protein PhCBS80983_g06184 [Powellomyces hirtus]|uniref:Flavodoxin-like domain-containing protein n=1 Tax=Powellomyces hirtus TaxID=109895 RepID=A0A507DQ08_9FUNG|nr:hypothetical protein PhCBS80983_g06184 [Powellomyces hirtus]